MNDCDYMYISNVNERIDLNFTITNLKPNTEYKINIKATKIYNQITGYSKSQTIKTLLNPTKPRIIKFKMSFLLAIMMNFCL